MLNERKERFEQMSKNHRREKSDLSELIRKATTTDDHPAYLKSWGNYPLRSRRHWSLCRFQAMVSECHWPTHTIFGYRTRTKVPWPL